MYDKSGDDDDYDDGPDIDDDYDDVNDGDVLCIT